MSATIEVVGAVGNQSNLSCYLIVCHRVNGSFGVFSSGPPVGTGFSEVLSGRVHRVRFVYIHIVKAG